MILATVPPRVSKCYISVRCLERDLSVLQHVELNSYAKQYARQRKYEIWLDTIKLASDLSGDSIKVFRSPLVLKNKIRCPRVPFSAYLPFLYILASQYYKRRACLPCKYSMDLLGGARWALAASSRRPLLINSQFERSGDVSVFSSCSVGSLIVSSRTYKKLISCSENLLSPKSSNLQQEKLHRETAEGSCKGLAYIHAS